MTRRRSHLLSHLLADAAARQADGDALVGDGVTLDHETLASRVARLGTALRTAGVEPGDRVVVSGPKSVGTFVAMHAALHAGAIAAPVDPFAPEAVVRDVIRLLAPTAAVLAPTTAAGWPADAEVTVTVGAPLPGSRIHLSEADVEAIGADGPVDRLGDDPAYVITTSGSTGRPKSIVHTHASGLRYAELASECYELHAGDRMANVAPFHFDQSTFELYAAPLVGAAAVLVPDVLLRFPANVSELLERERVTTWYSVPTILRQLVERGALDRRDLSALRWVLFGGEVFPAAPLRRLMEMLPAARLSNVYGPAEVNQCTFHHLDGPPASGDAIPIGRPWADTEVRLVDVDGSELPGSGRGELLVRTSTAMAGYWGRPDLTEQAFLVEPTAGDLHRRWYRTGDVVDRDGAGVLTFVGRVDRQVKVRGVRVELEAIESVLGAIDGVTGSAAVVVDDDAPLVGIVEAATVDEAVVRDALREALPPAVIPDRVVIVAELPRTTSGKVDSGRAAALLATPDAAESGATV